MPVTTTLTCSLLTFTSGVVYFLLGVTQLEIFTLTLTLSLKGEGIAELRKSCLVWSSVFLTAQRGVYFRLNTQSGLTDLGSQE